MCLLVVRKKGTWLPSETEIENAWQANSDGFGIGYSHRGKLYIGKTLKLEEAKGYIAAVPENAPLILHWRYATRGVISEENCHPYSCVNGEWLGAHNGVLTRQPLIAGKTDSESYLLSLKTKPKKAKLEQDINQLGYGKIGLISVQGEVIIANEAEGDWRIKSEVWQSNSGLDGWGSGLPISSSSYWPTRRTNTLHKLSCDYCGALPEYSDGRDYFCSGCVEDMERRELF